MNGDELDTGKAARLVAVLLITEEDDLEGYRRRCIGQDSDLSPDHLRAARDLLGAIGSTLLSSEESRWDELRSAREALCRSPLDDATGDDDSGDAPADDQAMAAPVSAQPSALPSPAPPPVASDPAAAAPGEAPRESGPALPSPRPPPVSTATPSPSRPLSVPPPRPPAAADSEPRPPSRLAASALPPPRTPPKPAALSAPPSAVPLPVEAASPAHAPPTSGHSEPESTALISLPVGRAGADGAPPGNRPALPFQQNPSRPPPPPSHAKPKPSIPLGGTIGVSDLLSPLHNAPATPFEPETGSTIGIADQISPLHKAPATPFEQEAADSSPSPAEPHRAAPATIEASPPSAELATLEQEPPSQEAAEDDLASTIATDPADHHEGTALIDPDRIRAGAGPPPRLNIVAYAWLCVQCEAQPERTAEINVEHGLADAQARQRLDDHWERRFQAEPHTQQRFAALLNHYRERGGP